MATPKDVTGHIQLKFSAPIEPNTVQVTTDSHFLFANREQQDETRLYYGSHEEGQYNINVSFCAASKDGQAAERKTITIPVEIIAALPTEEIEVPVDGFNA